MADLELAQWIIDTFPESNLTTSNINFSTSTKNDGYLGEIHFVKVTTPTTTLHLVVKNSKRSEALRKAIPIAQIFVQEILVYETIFPCFIKLQRDKNVTPLFEPIPKYYRSIVMPNLEVMIMEDLKAAGYEMHERTRALNFAHVKLMLEQYGKLHALSYAMQDQRKEEFDSYSRDVFDTNVGQIESGFGDLVLPLMVSASKALKEKFCADYTKEVKHLLEESPNVLKQLLNLLNGKEKYRVLSHGDAWINNYLFLYDSKDKSVPARTVLIDWQMAAFKPSPVFDLSHFIYSCASFEDLRNIDKLLEIYYKTFETFLKQLGSNAHDMLSYEDLVAHWKKYSLYGFFFAHYVLKQSFWSDEQAAEMEKDFVAGKMQENKVDDLVIDNDEYYKRLLGVYQDFFKK